MPHQTFHCAYPSPRTRSQQKPTRTANTTISYHLQLGQKPCVKRRTHAIAAATPVQIPAPSGSVSLSYAREVVKRGRSAHGTANTPIRPAHSTKNLRPWILVPARIAPHTARTIIITIPHTISRTTTDTAMLMETTIPERYSRK